MMNQIFTWEMVGNHIKHPFKKTCLFRVPGGDVLLPLKTERSHFVQLLKSPVSMLCEVIVKEKNTNSIPTLVGGFNQFEKY